jgi:hypothetical protein
MPSRLKVVLTLSLFVLSLNISLTAQSTAKCGFQTLNIQGPPGTRTRPLELSDKGAIVGFLQQGTDANLHTTGFLLSDGKFTHFRFPGSSLSAKGLYSFALPLTRYKSCRRASAQSRLRM